MSDERFARQYRYEPPPEFPLALPCTGIVHHLSGPNRYAHTQTSLNCLVGRWCAGSQQSLSLRAQVCHPHTRTYVRLLGPCFKTGRMKPFSQRVDSGPMLTPRGRTGKPVQPPGQAADTLPPQSGQGSQQRVSPRRTQATNPTAVFPEPQLTLTLKARAITHRGTQQSHQDGLVSFAFPFSDFRHF